MTAKSQARALRTSTAPTVRRPGAKRASSPSWQSGVPAHLVSTAISSQDDVEPAEDAPPPAWHPDPVEEAQAADAEHDEAAPATTNALVPVSESPWWTVDADGDALGQTSGTESAYDLN